jgi:hypothetical protein
METPLLKIAQAAMVLFKPLVRPGRAGEHDAVLFADRNAL